MVNLNKEIKLQKPARPCPNCSSTISGTQIPVGWGPASGFTCPACRERLRSRHSYWHGFLSLFLGTLVIVGLLWAGGFLGEIDSGRTISGGDRRVFVNLLRSTLLLAVIAVGGAIAWVGNRLPHRVVAADAEDPHDFAIKTSVLLPVILVMLMMMATCVNVIVSSG